MTLKTYTCECGKEFHVMVDLDVHKYYYCKLKNEGNK